MEEIVGAARGSVPLVPVVVGEVLDQRAAERHVHDLHPAADAERRHAEPVGGVEQVDLERVAVGLEPGERWVRRLPEATWLDVAASDEQEGVEALEQLGRRALVPG